ncbi:siderophore-interacting protein [Compostimonas suwonensis]|uniref:NADPH-dependent ferric siderophore reductase n=1 Tax=Compostimonas suwonensis TaxID=1048394 RepID=A0A2M9BUJ9_9MICO|nr:siderophore-interacting protein [Compostimonas suwonensis]PJJ61626.1 NADPH-dependent ferric siderophore reductase [Compostimonas suwonensis]
MLTSLANTESDQRVWPPYRRFDVAVARIDRLSPHFVRITFTGDELAVFGTEGLDQRVKLVLPLPGNGVAHFPHGDDWFGEWRLLPHEHRNPIRTYTVRAVRPAARELDIDFVDHGDAGPASRWLRTARVGDRLAIVGPDARSAQRSVGIEWRPDAAGTLLLAGDETAVPAICSILGSLPATARGCALLEVPQTADILEVDAPAGVEVRWLARDGGSNAAAEQGALLDGAVRAWTGRFVADWHRDRRPGAGIGSAATAVLDDVDIDRDILWEIPKGSEIPEGSGIHRDFYAWLAGEAGVIKALRRFLVSELGIDRGSVAFMGYWRRGRAEID